MTLPSRHLDDEQAQRLVDGALSEVEALEVERHTAGCAKCRAAVDSYRLLADALGGLRVPALPDGFTEGVLSRIDARERAAERERRWALGIVATLLAATLAAFAAAGVSAWAPAISSAAGALGGSVHALRVGASFVPVVVGALRLQIFVAATVLALPLVVALSRLVPALRSEIV